MKDKGLFSSILKNDTYGGKDAKWGLVLSGGGTRGAYEVGAWKALQELRVPIRGISGTSIGALNAAMFLGSEIKQIEEIYRGIKMTDVLPVSEKIDTEKNVFDPSNLMGIAREYFARRGLDNGPLRNMLQKYLNVSRIYESALDLGIVTFNIKTRVAFELFKEDIEPDKLIDYLLASANFPIYKAQKVDGKQFMDGGLYDNMPFNPLIERGYTHVIVIDINGIGMTRKLENSDKVYLKMVSCSENLGGTFDFDHELIEKNMKLGYLDTMKAFHKLFGSYYFFRRTAFNDLLLKFDMDTIWGLETAARFYRLDRYRIYRADEFVDELEWRYDEEDRKYMNSSYARIPRMDFLNLRNKGRDGLLTAALVHLFRETPSLRGMPSLKAFSDLADAANAIIALKNYRKL